LAIQARELKLKKKLIIKKNPDFQQKNTTA
jgi:hypothetical protein